MRIKEIIVENYRCYRGQHRIPINALTAFIGKNDVGKSTIFEALDVFLNKGKLDSSDICVFTEKSCDVRIGCVFTEYPDEVIIDSSSKTSLRQEYLLNVEGHLEIHIVAHCEERIMKKQTVVAVAKHPTAEGFNNLLLKKNSELKQIGAKIGIPETVDKRSNVDLRQAIWQKSEDLKIDTTDVDLSNEDAKKIWEKIQDFLPEFFLFRAERPSTDGDGEVQDPLKIAVKQAIHEERVKLDEIKQKVEKHALEVADRTLVKLREFDSELASELKPELSSEPKWDSIFKFSLIGDDGIPVNRRGSGVRRLIVFSFFQAEAEKSMSEDKGTNIIYAIEEPETAQHPTNQRKVIEALIKISDSDNRQVMITTHVPGLASILPISSLRFITTDEEDNRIIQDGSNSEGVLKKIADDLGVLPNSYVTGGNVEVAVFVEGPTDVEFLKHACRLLRTEDASLIDIENDPKVVVLPLGGSNLQYWVNKNYIEKMNLRQVHIYDCDRDATAGRCKYQDYVDSVNNRGDGSFATSTKKREIENYYHIDAINDAIQNTPLRMDGYVITDICDVENDLTNIFRTNGMKVNVKNWLTTTVLNYMTLDRIKDRGGYEEIKSWLVEIGT